MNTKRKRADDVTRRLAVGSTATAGRGSATGWTTCPLCNSRSSSNTKQSHQRKRFALGRGIAAHLHAVHTPWNQNPSLSVTKTKKASRRKRQREGRAQEEEEPEDRDCTSIPTSTSTSSTSWEPSPEEVDTWQAKVIEIVKQLEEEQTGSTTNSQHSSVSCSTIGPGLNRNGSKSETYNKSLPPFLKAAAQGDLETLRAMVNAAAIADGQTDDDAQTDRAKAEADHDVVLLELLNTRDRHHSIAEHWAAGGGHLECLKYLVELRRQCIASTSTTTTTAIIRKDQSIRRRDGKTSLHYAARNGRLDCIQYLLSKNNAETMAQQQQQQQPLLYNTVNETSGDGTTPLHLACFGGHVEAVQMLLDKGAHVMASNDWGCTSAHWVGMNKEGNCDKKETFRLCNLIQQQQRQQTILNDQKGSDVGANTSLSIFVQPQKQGHTALHKAAQRRNCHVIEWMAQEALPVHHQQQQQQGGGGGGAGLSKVEQELAGKPDAGGHTPSDIWLAAGGEEAFATWMREEMKW